MILRPIAIVMMIIHMFVLAVDVLVRRKDEAKSSGRKGMKGFHHGKGMTTHPKAEPPAPASAHAPSNVSARSSTTPNSTSTARQPTTSAKAATVTAGSWPPSAH